MYIQINYRDNNNSLEQVIFKISDSVKQPNEDCSLNLSDAANKIQMQDAENRFHNLNYGALDINTLLPSTPSKAKTNNTVKTKAVITAPTVPHPSKKTVQLENDKTIYKMYVSDLNLYQQQLKLNEQVEYLNLHLSTDAKKYFAPLLCQVTNIRTGDKPSGENGIGAIGDTNGSPFIHALVGVLTGGMFLTEDGLAAMVTLGNAEASSVGAIANQSEGRRTKHEICLIEEYYTNKQNVFDAVDTIANNIVININPNRLSRKIFIGDMWFDRFQLNPNAHFRIIRTILSHLTILDNDAEQTDNTTDDTKSPKQDHKATVVLPITEATIGNHEFDQSFHKTIEIERKKKMSIKTDDQLLVNMSNHAGVAGLNLPYYDFSTEDSKQANTLVIEYNQLSDEATQETKQQLTAKINEQLTQHNEACDQHFKNARLPKGLFQNAIILYDGNKKILLMHHGICYSTDSNKLQTAFGEFILSDYTTLEGLVCAINAATQSPDHISTNFRPKNAQIQYLIRLCKLFEDTTVVHGHDGEFSADTYKPTSETNTSPDVIAINSRCGGLFQPVNVFVPFTRDKTSNEIRDKLLSELLATKLSLRGITNHLEKRRNIYSRLANRGNDFAAAAQLGYQLCIYLLDTIPKKSLGNKTITTGELLDLFNTALNSNQTLTQQAARATFEDLFKAIMNGETDDNIKTLTARIATRYRDRIAHTNLSYSSLPLNRAVSV